MNKERYKVIPDTLTVFVKDGIASVTINCNVRPKHVKITGDNLHNKYEDWYEADTNSFIVDASRINWNELFDTPYKYLDY